MIDEPVSLGDAPAHLSRKIFEAWLRGEELRTFTAGEWGPCETGVLRRNKAYRVKPKEIKCKPTQT